MAAVSTADLQSAIDSLMAHDSGSPAPVKVLQEIHDSATYSRWYVVGDSSSTSTPAVIRGPRAMWVKTTVSGNAAAQAGEVLAAMSINSNVDPDAEV